jgi:hypothetical protein
MDKIKLNVSKDEMTLRDYFAAKALDGILSCGPSLSLYELVERAYRIADLMLEERSE